MKPKLPIRVVISYNSSLFALSANHHFIKTIETTAGFKVEECAMPCEG